MVKNPPLLGPQKSPSNAQNLLRYIHSPGRFFAATELKVLLAYIICNYDFKTAAVSERERPKNNFFSFLCSPDPDAELLFRVRVDAGVSFLNRQSA
jgi:hypothetical protein